MSCLPYRSSEHSAWSEVARLAEENERLRRTAVAVSSINTAFLAFVACATALFFAALVASQPPRRAHASDGPAVDDSVVAAGLTDGVLGEEPPVP